MNNLTPLKHVTSFVIVIFIASTETGKHANITAVITKLTLKGVALVRCSRSTLIPLAN